MKAVGYRKALPIEDADALLDVVLPDPIPDRRDLLVEIRAISVNPADTKARRFARASLFFRKIRSRRYADNFIDPA